MEQENLSRKQKLGVVSGVYIPVCLNILSILMFLRFGLILGQVGLLGMLGLLFVSYLVDLVTTLSLSAVASNGEVKGGGAYYLISRSLGPEFGGSIGLLFYLSQVFNTALNVVGLIDCLKLNLGSALPQGYWWGYLIETCALLVCTTLCLAGSGIFAKASNGLLVILFLAILSIPMSAFFMNPFDDPDLGTEFTGIRLSTLKSNLFPPSGHGEFKGVQTLRDLFGILFPATSGIFAGASMSGDLRNPSRAIPKGTLWAMLTTLVAYLLVILSMASSTTHASFILNANIIPAINIWPPIILAGECAVTFFSALMGVIGSAKLMQALARDKLFPGLAIFGQGTKKLDEPLVAILLTYLLAQLALFADLNQIATFISMGYQMTFFTMNLACFLLKVGSAPNFRPGFKFFSWQTAFIGAIMSAAAMFFIDETYAAAAVVLLILLFLFIHYLSPPKHWGDVSQNLIYHQVRKYLLRLKPEHIKFWRPHIILLINDPRSQTRLIQFCNSMKKGSLYILGHVIVTDDFISGVQEAKLQQSAWTRYISEFSRIKAFVQLTMSPSITWGVRNLILSAGLGGMRPNIAVLGFYNMEELRRSRPPIPIPDLPMSPTAASRKPPPKLEGKTPRRRRGDTSARLLEGFLPTDVIRTEEMMHVTSYMTIVEDLALRYRLNVAIGKGFHNLETPRKDDTNTKEFIDLWPVQMSAELQADGKSVLTTNFDTYTLILQLGYILQSVPTWNRAYKLRVMVFVEYASEVEEEQGRVKALLEKLRIEAEVHVFFLSCGELNTYEWIVQGTCNDPITETLVNECLKEEEWWEDLQTLRHPPQNMSGSQELASLQSFMESTAGRPGLYNPHVNTEDLSRRRRSSVAVLADLARKPTVSKLVRMGVNMGIHTQNLPDAVLESDSEVEIGEICESAVGSSDEHEDDVDFNDLDSDSDGDMLELEPARHPLLSFPKRRDTRRKENLNQKGTGSRPRDVLTLPRLSEAPTGHSYGTMSSSKTLTVGDEAGREQLINRLAQLNTRKHLRTHSTQSISPVKASHGEAHSDPQSPTHAPATPQRPGLSRQGSAMRFTSSLVPETKIISTDGSGPTISFADTEGRGAPRPERPTFSRQSSTGRFSSRPMPETKVNTTEEGVSGPTLSFAEPQPRSAARSRKNSEPTDIQISIGDLSSNNKLRQGDDDEAASEYSSQEAPLSFNDLPSRAQHLILNDLMRQNSSETAVLFTTLPIPEEGTRQSEEASVQYLSDIEVLCNDLPPVLLVLSNNMTVTVSL